MAQPADTTAATADLAALEALADAVEAGAGLPDVERAAARALEASLVVLDQAGHVLAVAARSPAEEQTILAGGEEVEVIALQVGGEPVGELRIRLRADSGLTLARIVAVLIAGEVQRAHAPHRASADAAAGFVEALIAGELGGREGAVVAATEVGLELRTPRDLRARRFVALVTADPGGEASIAQLARKAGVSLRTLERCFLAETGVAVGEWRRRHRLFHALRLLEGGASVTAVALEIGYASTSAFSHAFARQFGRSPSRRLAAR
jgi:AraC-like DNA-binding protein